MAEPEPVLVSKTVTCRVAGCANADIPITVMCVDVVMCGVCAQEITDVHVDEEVVVDAVV